MAVPVKRSTKKTAPALPENSTPSEILASTMIADRVDITPSVRRIMDSTLGEDGRLAALTLFQGALGTLGDPMRNPVNAIEAGRSSDPA